MSPQGVLCGRRRHHCSHQPRPIAGRRSLGWIDAYRVSRKPYFVSEPADVVGSDAETRFGTEANTSAFTNQLEAGYWDLPVPNWRSPASPRPGMM
jgi:hypothetical protein